ncbi:O-antigen ligase family protein [Acinetobacter defluvii]|nr:O-antigen ligase family protein [Acinetobacter defluvii]
MFKIMQSNLYSRQATVFISILFLVFFFYYILNEKFRLWYISLAFVVAYLYTFKKNIISIKPNLTLMILCCISIFTCTLSYYLFDRLDDLPSKGYLKTYKRLIDQYFYFLAFLTLPTIFYAYKFTPKIFFTTIYIALIFTGGYITYFNIFFDFNRGQLSAFFNPIITYNIGLISLSVLGLFYAFYDQSKKSYVLLTISLISMFSLILQGTRGAWLALPFIYFLIISSYFKQQNKKCLFFLATLFIFIAVNIALPNSPLKNRMNAFQQDSVNIQESDYQNSTGLRLLLWKNSIELFKTQPVLGISLYGVEKNNCELQTQGKLPQCFQHQHSIYFNELAAHGLLGIFGLLITLLLPFIYFVKNFSRSNENLKLLTLSGAAFVFYFAVCGLTEYYLFFLNTTYMYFLIVATLISFIQLEKHQFKKKL